MKMFNKLKFDWKLRIGNWNLPYVGFSISKLRRRLKLYRKAALVVSLITILILAPLAYLMSIAPKATEAAWFDDDYAYRQPFSFTHNADISDDRRVTFSLDTAELISAGVMQADCDDTRFTDINGKVLRYELTGTCNDAATTYEVVFPSIINGTNPAYVYYGNPSAISASDSTVSNVTALTPSGGDPSITDRTEEEKGPGPALYLKFDEGHGTTANDNSPNANDGSISGAAWQTEDLCLSDKCLFYDGTDDVVTVTNADSIDLDRHLAGEFTIQAWVRVNSDGEGDVGQIFSKGGSTYLRTTSEASGAVDLEASLDLATTDATVTVTDGLTLNRWHHVALAYTDDADDEITVYIDGNSRATSTNGDGAPASDANDLLIAGATTANFHGFIDEFKIYDQERSADEIKTDFTQGTSPHGAGTNLSARDYSYLSDGLVGYWNLNESSDGSAQVDRSDSSGNNFDLTDNNTTASTTGKFSNAGDFNSTDDTFLSCTDASCGGTGNLDMGASEAFSIAVWVKTSTSGDGFVTKKSSTAGGGSGYAIGTGPGGEPRVYYSDDTSQTTVDATTDVTDNTWHHIAYVSDGQTAYVFVDGVLENTGDISGITGSLDNTEDFKIGEFGGGTRNLDGQTDDVRVYKRNLSPSEVLELYKWGPRPLAYWNFDDNTGTGADAVKDISTNAYHGTTNGSMTNSDWVPEQIGSALELDGNDDYINIPTEDGNFSSDIFTISGWFTRNTDSGAEEILLDNRDAANDGFRLYITSADVITCEYNGTAASTGGSLLTAGGTDHIACVSDGSTLKLYEDGTLQTSESITGSISETTDFTIGRASFESSGFFPGVVDEVKVYNYARTDAQLIEDRNAGHPAPGSPIGSPAAWWKFDEGGVAVDACPSDVEICDSSPNENDLNIAGSSAAKFTADGKFDAALDSNGGTGWASRADDSDLDFAASQDFTVSMWFKSDSATNPSATEYLLSKFESTGADGGYAFFAQTDGDIVFGIDDENTSFPEDTVGDIGEDVYDATWHHIVAVKTGTSKLELYVDGVLKDTNSSLTATGTLENNDIFFIGDLNASDDGNEFVGAIDETLIFRSAFTPSQVKMLFNRSYVATFGVLGTDSSGNPDNSRARSYCIPGDTSTCNAPLAHWAMDENQGQRVKNISAGAADNGTLGGSTTVEDNDPTWTTGKVGQTLDFDGVDDHVGVGDDDDLDFADTDDFTITAWVYRDTFTTDDVIVSKKSSTSGSSRQGYIVYIDDANDDINFRIEDPSGDGGDEYTMNSTTTITSEGWNHIAIVFDQDSDANSTIYINGVDDKESSTGIITDVGSPANIQPFQIGENSSGGEQFAGKIDDVKIYTDARTPAQIVWDYSRGAPVGYWKFDENTGTTANDSSGNDFSGTLTNSPTWVSGKRNTALDFERTSSQYVTIADNETLSALDAYTVSAWINIESVNTGDQMTIVGHWSGTAGNREFLLNVDTDGTVHLDDGSANLVSSSTVLNTGQWYHVVGTYDIDNNTADQIKVYVNGKLEGTSSARDVSQDADEPVTVGTRDGGTPDQFFDGIIDDARVYNYELTAEQIRNVYNHGVLFFGPSEGSP